MARLAPRKTVCLWSGPRNVSTALMYSFGQRADTVIVDEPLYGHYLRVSGALHPGRDEVLAAMNCDGPAVMRQLLDDALPAAKSTLFLKQMAHHLTELPFDFMTEMVNVFLIRDPREMLPSLTVQLPDATLADTGLRTQWQLFERLQAAGATPIVLDSRLLLLDPAGILRRLCGGLGIPYEAGMLSWPRGSRPEDGVWAKHWYHSVHDSSGFQAYRPKSDFPPRLEPLLSECSPYYQRLFAHALSAKETDS